MKIAIVTGASSGIGKEFTKKLDNKNLDEIWVIARRENLLKELKEDIITPLKIFKMDLTEDKNFLKIKDILKEETPEIIYLVNSAGFGKFGKTHRILEEANSMMDLNIKALVNITCLCIPYMKRGSHIIEMGSSSSFNPLMNFNVYASTKAFVVHFSNGLYKELKPKGIKVTAICPGWTDTEFFKRADGDITKNAPKFFKPLYKTSYVVATALKDNEKGKMISTPGMFTKTHYIFSKIMPKKILMNIWEMVQK